MVPPPPPPAVGVVARPSYPGAVIGRPLWGSFQCEGGGPVGTGREGEMPECGRAGGRAGSGGGPDAGAQR